MVFVGTEHDGLVHPASLFKIGGNFPCYLLDAVFDDDVVVVVGVVVDAVFDRVSENVALPLCGSPLITDVGLDVDEVYSGSPK